QSRRPVPALSLPYDHELRQGLPQGAQPVRSHCRAQTETGRTADVTIIFAIRGDPQICWDDKVLPNQNSSYYSVLERSMASDSIRGCIAVRGAPKRVKT